MDRLDRSYPAHQTDVYLENRMSTTAFEPVTPSLAKVHSYSLRTAMKRQAGGTQPPRVRPQCWHFQSFKPRSAAASQAASALARPGLREHLAANGRFSRGEGAVQ